MWESLLDLLKAGFSWLVSIITGFAAWVADQIVALLPDAVTMQWEWIGPYASAANAWLPLSEFFTLLGLLWAFQLGFVAFKFTWKAIPGTG